MSTAAKQRLKGVVAMAEKALELCGHRASMAEEQVKRLEGQ